MTNENTINDLKELADTDLPAAGIAEAMLEIEREREGSAA